jgi:hypothetical protein
MKNYAKLIETIVYQTHFKSNLFHICLSCADKTMEQKRFGVKNSSIEELRLFQLGLRRERMGFETRAKVFFSSEKAERRVKANNRKLTIIPSNPKIYLFKLPRQQLLQLDETTITLHLDDILNINIQFCTVQECERFKAALGNLGPE